MNAWTMLPNVINKRNPASDIAKRKCQKYPPSTCAASFASDKWRRL